MGGSLGLYLQGMYGKGNLGDDLIFLSVLEIINRFGANLDKKVVVFFPCPLDAKLSFYDANSFPFVALHPFQERKLPPKKLVKRIDYCVLGGGGLFPTDSAKSYLHLWIKWKWMSLVKRKIRFCCFGIDLVSIRSRISGLIWRRIMNLADFVYLRNRYSYELLKRHASKRNLGKLSYGVDLVFGCSFLERFLTALDADENTVNGPYLVWCLANPWSPSEMKQEHFQNRYSKLVADISTMISFAESRGFRSVFVNFFDDVDHIFTSACINASGVPAVAVLNGGASDVGLLSRTLNNACAVVSMRFHGNVLGLRFGKPTLGIAYSPKTEQLFEDFSLGAYCIEFGIRKSDCFFREFDLDKNKALNVLNNILDSNRDNRNVFQRIKQQSNHLSFTGIEIFEAFLRSPLFGANPHE